MSTDQAANPYEPPREDCRPPDADLIAEDVVTATPGADSRLPGPIVWAFWLCGGSVLGTLSGSAVFNPDSQLFNLVVGMGLLTGFIGGGIHALYRRLSIPSVPPLE